MVNKLSFLTDESPIDDFITIINMCLEPFDLKFKRAYSRNRVRDYKFINISDNEDNILKKIAIQDIISNDFVRIKLDENREIEFWGRWVEIRDRNKGRFITTFNYNYEPASKTDILNFYSNCYNSRYKIRKCVINEFDIRTEAPDKSWTEWMAFVCDGDSISYNRKTNTLSFEANRDITDFQKISISDDKNGVYKIAIEGCDSERIRILEFIYKMPNNKSKGSYIINYKEGLDKVGEVIETGDFDGDLYSMIINNRLIRNCIGEIISVYKNNCPKFILPKRLMNNYSFILPLKDTNRRNVEALKYLDMTCDFQVFDAARKEEQRKRKK